MGAPAGMAHGVPGAPERSRSAPGAPMWLLAELTYKCPLHCVFCSNPTNYAQHESEIGTEDWKRVFREARKMGAVQLGFSGGEPLLRDDLEELVAEARTLGYYTNLITSGIGLTEKRARVLKEAGLDHIQLSFQDSTKELNDFLSSTRTFEHKSKVAAIIKGLGYPMVLNCVMHRYNLPHVGRIIDMAERMGADFLELANTQYYGWAWLNRSALMPTPQDLADAEGVVDASRQRLAGRMKILWVSPDYVDAKPKPCMAGWGAVFMVIAPDGVALPCHSARMLGDAMGFEFPKVTEHGIESIWRDSAAFNRYRGTGWMSETCKSCDQHTIDHGGCRCQAFLVTGDAAATDPVCPKSPHRGLIDEAIEGGVSLARAVAAAPSQPLRFVPGAARSGSLWYRTDSNSRALGGEVAAVESAAVGEPT